MLESIRCISILPATPQEIYHAWMDSVEHGNFTGDKAVIDPRVGGQFSAWGGYITGHTLELEPNRRIVQAWRTDEFPADASDSRLEILLKSKNSHTEITLNHSEIPDGQGEQYRQGWEDYYFAPMKQYFSEQRGE